MLCCHNPAWRSKSVQCSDVASCSLLLMLCGDNELNIGHPSLLCKGRCVIIFSMRIGVVIGDNLLLPMRSSPTLQIQGGHHDHPMKKFCDCGVSVWFYTIKKVKNYV